MKKNFPGRIIALPFLFLLLICLQIPHASGSTRIIDANSPTQAQIDASQPGDTLLFAPGDHDHFDLWEKQSTECNPLVLMSQDADNPAVINNTTKPGHPTFHIDKCSYVVVENLEVTGGITGIEVSFSDHVIIRECEIHHIGVAGFKIRFLSSWVDFINNKIHHTGRSQPQYGEGIYIGSAKWKSYWPIPEDQPDINMHIWIEGNEFYECGNGEAIDAKGNTQHLTIRNNHIHHIYPGMEDVQTNEAAISLSNGIDGSGEPADFWVEGNVIEEIFWGEGDISNHAVNGSGICTFGGGHYILNNSFGNCAEACIQYSDYMVRNDFMENAHFIYEYGNTFDNATGEDWNTNTGELEPYIHHEDPGFSNPNSPQFWWCMPTYALSVEAGSGEGSFAASRTIPIRADDPVRGQAFDRWTGDTAGVTDIFRADTWFTMDTLDASITATYKALPLYNLTVNQGSGSGSYYEGDTIYLEADAAPEGYVFEKWTGDVARLSTQLNPSTRLVMPADSTTISANFKEITYRLSTINGFGSGQYVEGDTIIIEAKPPREGKEFTEWTGDIVYVADPYSPKTEVVMPAFDISVFANNQDIVSAGLNQVEQDFQVYPNPTRDFLSISYEGDYSLSLYNVQGMEFASFRSCHKSQHIDVSAWPKGMYFIRLTSMKINRVKSLCII